MLQWLGGLFSSDKVVSDITDKDNGHLAKLGGWVGNWNFTEEEQSEANREVMKLTTERIKAMAPFKVMQRIMVTIIMSVWAWYCLNMSLAIWLYSDDVINDILLFVQTPFVWVPVSGAVTTYLLGGVTPTRK